MNCSEVGRQRGQKAGKGANRWEFVTKMHATIAAAKLLYPTAADMDWVEAVRKFDAERLASQPDLGRLPELKGHIDLLWSERQAFREASGLDEAATAFQYSWHFFLSRRITSRHLARYDLIPAQRACTNVFFPDGADGVTISDNRDDLPRAEYVAQIPKHRPEGLLKQDPVSWVQGGASSGVLLDDEPQCLFPANPFEYNLFPDECFNDINAMTEFGQRYREFYGPGNMIWVDRKLNAVAVDKTNCLVAFRKPTSGGAIAITACAYLDDRLHAHQMAKTRKAMAIKGENEKTSLDLNYHLGSRERYRRLVALADAEAARPGGASLWGALEAVNDHDAPFPERVCLAGEKGLPEKEPNANWTLTQHAAVISGPKRRCLYRSLQDLRNPRPVYEYKPKLMLGPGVKMDPAWQADIDAGRCELTPPVQ